jgi:serine carboxypeptidase-like clade 4
VPAIGWKIVDANAAGGAPRLNLQGIAIGNGLVEPLTQYGAYADFMADNDMIDADTQKLVNAAYHDACAPAITACQASSAAAARAGATGAPGESVGAAGGMACIVAADTCNAGVMQPVLTAAAAKAHHSINVYDIRDACSHPPLCYDFSDLEAYMALPDVLSSLGVAGRAWTECTTSVHLLLTDDWMQNLEVHIPATLAAGVRVLIYAGDMDFICNVEGNRRWVDAMAWAGAADFAAAPLTAWSVGGQQAGTARAAKGLTFLSVADAGHMVPMDQPGAALDMLRRFIDNKPFTDDGPLPLTPLEPPQQSGVVGTAEALWGRLVSGVTGRVRRAAEA